MADIYSQVVLSNELTVSPQSKDIRDITIWMNNIHSSDLQIPFRMLVDLRGSLALPFDEHFVTTTVEALDYARRHITLSRMLYLLASADIPVDETMSEDLRAYIYGHSYDDEWKRELHSYLQSSPQWREALTTCM